MIYNQLWTKETCLWLFANVRKENTTHQILVQQKSESKTNKQKKKKSESEIKCKAKAK
jgi:hypothetical protein